MGKTEYLIKKEKLRLLYVGNPKTAENMKLNWEHSFVSLSDSKSISFVLCQALTSFSVKCQ